MGEVGEVVAAPALVGSALADPDARRVVPRRSKDGGKFNDIGDVNDRRRLEFGGCVGVTGEVGVVGVFGPKFEDWSGARYARSASGERTMVSSCNIGVGGNDGVG